jgi:quercetin dioxygenase-like cupin family protein
MRTSRLQDMTKGWFIGSFSPTLLDTRAVEVAVKEYRAGDREDEHYHKIATEFTAVISGTVAMNGRQWTAGDIIVIDPGEATDFQAITDAVTVVVKIPGATHDKYYSVS